MVDRSTPVTQPAAPDLAISPSLGGRVLGGFGASVLGGAALGALAWWTDELGFPWTAYIPANAIGAWLGLAFVLGASARTIPTGGLRGLLGLVSAVAAYYVLIGGFGDGFRAIGASHAATVWGAVALLAGPVFGLTGATWRHRHGRQRSIAVGVLAAALIAEGVVFGAPRWARGDQVATDPGAFVLAAAPGAPPKPRPAPRAGGVKPRDACSARTSGSLPAEPVVS